MQLHLLPRPDRQHDMLGSSSAGCHCWATCNCTTVIPGIVQVEVHTHTPALVCMAGVVARSEQPDSSRLLLLYHCFVAGCCLALFTKTYLMLCCAVLCCLQPQPDASDKVREACGGDLAAKACSKASRQVQPVLFILCLLCSGHRRLFKLGGSCLVWCPLAALAVC